MIKNPVAFFRAVGAALLLLVLLGGFWGGIEPVRAGETSQQGEPAGSPIPIPVEATLGEPAVVNRAPKDPQVVQPTDKLLPSPGTTPPLPPDPLKEAPARELPSRDATSKSYWTVLMSEGFEGSFPNGLWNPIDANGATGGDVVWDDDDFKPHTDYWSAWAANGGANGVDPQYNYYPNDMDSWMVYGPFDLSSCALADYSFYYWNKSESGYDQFQWLASPNGVNFYGYGISGDQSTWNYVDMPLPSYLGDSSVWLAFRFVSDGSVSDVGAFVDDITLWCYTDTSTVSWTYMVYLDGDNNLEAAAVDDFMEMSSVGSSANVDIVVQLDRIGGYSTAYDDWTDTKRFHVTTGMTPTIANAITGIGEANMGDPETLLNFVRWGRAAYPANNYALVIWDHGSGWKMLDPDAVLTKSIASDDTNGDSITMPELRSTLNTLTGAGANPLELFGMDACLMAMIEVDNQIKPYADVRVGSQETEPADGWPHNTILTGLTANPGWTASQLATRIVDDYYISYGSNWTQSAVNLGSLYTTLNTSVDTFANTLMAWAPYYRTEVANARNVAQTFTDTQYIDLWDFADYVSIYASSSPDLLAAATAVENADLAAVIRNQHGSSWPYARGTSIYFPKTAGEYDARYDGSSGFLQFTAATHWDEWLRMYPTLASYPANFNKSSPANGATGQLLSLTLSWGASSGATSYQYCIDTTNDNACSVWVNAGASTSAGVSGLSASTTYYWHVRAVNGTGTLYSNLSPTAYWSFTTGPLPGAFSKSSPANGAANQPTSLTLSWGTSTNATQYQYCYDTTNDNACSSWVSTGTSTSASLSGLAFGTTYYWQVRALNSIGTTYANGASTAFWNFTTGSPPAAFYKSSPANGATNQQPSLTLSWGTATGASSYEYCYDTSNDGACSAWTSVGASTSVGISGLAYGTTYYWHVRAINSFGTTYSNGSAMAFWAFTTGSPPAAFSKTSPANGAAGQLLSLTLSWAASSGATSYDYCIDTTNDGACSMWVNTGTATSASISSLAASTTYYWQVRALNSIGTTYANGASTAFWSFTTGPLPGAFNKTSPANGATNQPTSLALFWGASTNATSYQYCYDTTNDNACSTWTSVGAATSASIGGLSYGTTYYWHARAVNSIGTTYSNGSSTAFWSFTTGSPPAAFSKTSPANGATNQPVSLALSWGTATGAASYEYCYDTSNDGACSAWTGTGTATSASISGLSYGTTYYWQVRALNSFGVTYANGASTAFWAFTTGSPPGAFSKTSPANGATGQPVSLTLAWGAAGGATSYEYCYDTTNDGACSAWTGAGTATSAGISGLPYATTYYWQVRATNSFGTTYANGASTAYWSFTTGSPPGAFSKTSPANGAANQLLSLTLSWGASSGASSYEYCYDTTNDSACSAWTSAGAATSVGISGLSASTTYYWQVRAVNSITTTYANGASTAFWAFTTGSPPAAFGKVSPPNGAAGLPPGVVLGWDAASGASSYEYCIDSTDDGACSAWISAGTATSVTPGGLAGNMLYFWQVRAINAYGVTYANGSGAAFWSFITADWRMLYLPLIMK